LLTDAGTFSSGTLFAVLVRDNHLGRIVGEAAGNSASFNGTEYPVALSGTDYYLNLTTARLLRPDAGAPADASIEPDDPVTATGADLAAGRDVQLDFVLDSR
jgi:C-terminal processing protease CtpA/Prc